MGGGPALDINWWNGLREMICVFFLSFTRQGCRDTWVHPKSWTGHPIDHLLCRPRDHRFLGATKVLFEDALGESW